MRTALAMFALCSLASCSLLFSSGDGAPGQRDGGSVDAAAPGIDATPVDIDASAVPLQMVTTSIADGTDDVEEQRADAAGAVLPAAQILHLGSTGGIGESQYVGLRFAVGLPVGANVKRAHIQFQSAADNVGPMEANIYASKPETGNAPPFALVNGGVSQLSPVTSTQVLWAVTENWGNGTAGMAQRTPDLKSIVTELVENPSWQSGNHMVFVFAGVSGERQARAYEQVGSPATLTISYTVGD